MSGDFSDLPGTSTEAERVASAFSKRHRREEVTLLAGFEAGEAAVAAAMAGSGLVHLATHGFFATGRCHSVLASSEALGFNPMLLSGIVLSGANDPPDDGEDGMLTAEEVVGLDLRGVDLVVLSACDTGLGEVQSGEGVMGLRRAFAAAGAQSMVMSLWGVPDVPTVDLMAALYRDYGHKKRHLPAADALRRAQLEMLENNRRVHGEGRPGEWAAFIAVGQLE